MLRIGVIESVQRYDDIWYRDEVLLTMAWEASEDPPMLASIGALR